MYKCNYAKIRIYTRMGFGIVYCTFLLLAYPLLVSFSYTM
jgi:hypothetical protein